MAWYRNMYRCSECGTRWDDEWSCEVDDECPNCEASDFSPFDCEDLSVLIEETEDKKIAIYYSPISAEHYPDYILLAETRLSNLAKFLENMAHELAHPI